MTDYARMIADLAENGKNQKFLNSSDEHALIVLKNIVKYATSSIKTLCGNMCSEVSNDDEYIELVDKYLKGGHNRIFYILFDNYSSCFESGKIASVLKKYPTQVKIRRFKDEYSHLYYNGDPVHLTVSDNKSFRLETDINNKMAWGNFNDPIAAKEFTEVFDTYFADEYALEVSTIFNSNNRLSSLQN
ncbi:hypothetical protein [Dysgonomonas sp.]